MISNLLTLRIPDECYLSVDFTNLDIYVFIYLHLM
jgi:hypothetical protein